MGHGVGADVPAQVHELADLIPAHALTVAVVLRVEPAGVDEEVAAVAVAREDVVDAVAHRVVRVVEVEHDRPVGQRPARLPPGVQLVVVD